MQKMTPASSPDEYVAALHIHSPFAFMEDMAFRVRQQQAAAMAAIYDIVTSGQVCDPATLLVTIFGVRAVGGKAERFGA